MNRDSTIHSNKNNFFKSYEKHEKWRETANYLKLNEQEKQRVEWMIYFETEAKQNVIKTCRRFGISRKTFYKWLNRFTYNRQDIKSLRNISRRPAVVRGWEVSIAQERRISMLRKKYLHYGKKKLKILYSRKYGEEISCWKIERVIRKHKLYPNKEKQKTIAGELTLSREKPGKNFSKLEINKNLWFRFLMETLVLSLENNRRYIFTAVEYNSKLGYARMYNKKNPDSIDDFLFRINYFLQQLLYNNHIENKSDIIHYFPAKIKRPKKKKYFSWVKISKDNLEGERFNKTIEFEWLFDDNVDLDCNIFNKKLSSWLIEYNFNRPHQSLNYLTPAEHIKKESMKYPAKNRKSSHELVRKVIEYITKLDVDEYETLSVESIAADFGISRTKLWRCFKKTKQMNLQEYIFKMKINQAAVLLQTQPGLTIKQIAEKTGFYCYGYFFSIFKKSFGTTPGKYRELKEIKQINERQQEK